MHIGVMVQPASVAIPRFYAPRSLRNLASVLDLSSAQQRLRAELACTRLRKHMASLILEPHELGVLWQHLLQYTSAPCSAAHSIEEQNGYINYDDFSEVAELMPPHCRRAFFCASHFLKFKPDAYGRISVLHFFQWVRRKIALMQTRSELALFDSTGDGSLSERELEMWIGALIPMLPALTELREEFFPFYKVTAVRKFLFFLDPRRRGRVQIRSMLASPVTHELLELRRNDVLDEIGHNWFSLPYAEMLYTDYLELDTDQNGLLSASELVRYRGGGLTNAFVSRIFQECQYVQQPRYTSSGCSRLCLATVLIPGRTATARRASRRLTTSPTSILCSLRPTKERVRRLPTLSGCSTYSGRAGLSLSTCATSFAQLWRSSMSLARRRAAPSRMSRTRSSIWLSLLTAP